MASFSEAPGMLGRNIVLPGSIAGNGASRNAMRRRGHFFPLLFINTEFVRALGLLGEAAVRLRG